MKLKEVCLKNAQIFYSINSKLYKNKSYFLLEYSNHIIFIKVRILAGILTILHNMSPPTNIQQSCVLLAKNEFVPNSTKFPLYVQFQLEKLTSSTFVIEIQLSDHLILRKSSLAHLSQLCPDGKLNRKMTLAVIGNETRSLVPFFSSGLMGQLTN